MPTDTERLDWMERVEAHPIRNCGTWSVSWARDDGFTEWTFKGKNLRAAIDAAMAEERGE